MTPGSPGSLLVARVSRTFAGAANSTVHRRQEPYLAGYAGVDEGAPVFYPLLARGAGAFAHFVLEAWEVTI